MFLVIGEYNTNYYECEIRIFGYHESKEFCTNFIKSIEDKRKIVNDSKSKICKVPTKYDRSEKIKAIYERNKVIESAKLVSKQIAEELKGISSYELYVTEVFTLI